MEKRTCRCVLKVLRVYRQLRTMNSPEISTGWSTQCRDGIWMNCTREQLVGGLSCISFENKYIFGDVFGFDWCFDNFATSLFSKKTHVWASSIQQPAETAFGMPTHIPPRPDLAQVVAPGAEWGCIAPTKQLIREEPPMKHWWNPFCFVQWYVICILWIEMCPFCLENLASGSLAQTDFKHVLFAQASQRW